MFLIWYYLPTLVHQYRGGLLDTLLEMWLRLCGDSAGIGNEISELLRNADVDEEGCCCDHD